MGAKLFPRNYIKEGDPKLPGFKINSIVQGSVRDGTEKAGVGDFAGKVKEVIAVDSAADYYIKLPLKTNRDKAMVTINLSIHSYRANINGEVHGTISGAISFYVYSVQNDIVAKSSANIGSLRIDVYRDNNNNVVLTYRLASAYYTTHKLDYMYGAEHIIDEVSWTEPDWNKLDFAVQNITTARPTFPA